jgi:hypothetical protein
MSATKTFETLRAKCALVGIVLLRTDPADGPVRLLAVREGRVRMLLRIPVNVTRDSGNVTQDSGDRDRGRCCAI